MFAGKSQDFDSGNGVEVWVAMHQDQTRSIGGSGNKSIRQGQTTRCGRAQADCREARPGIEGNQSGEADGVMMKDILPHFSLGHQFTESGIEFDPRRSRKGDGTRPFCQQGINLVRARLVQIVG